MMSAFVAESASRRSDCDFAHFRFLRSRPICEWQTAEVSMSKTIHSTQIVTPFGSGYVPEDHGLDNGPGPALEEPRKRGQVGHRADGGAVRCDDCGSGHLGVEPELCVGAETLAAKPAFNSDEAPRVLRPRRGAVLRQRGSLEWSTASTGSTPPRDCRRRGRR